MWSRSCRGYLGSDGRHTRPLRADLCRVRVKGPDPDRQLPTSVFPARRGTFWNNRGIHKMSCRPSVKPLVPSPAQIRCTRNIYSRTPACRLRRAVYWRYSTRSGNPSWWSLFPNPQLSTSDRTRSSPYDRWCVPPDRTPDSMQPLPLWIGHRRTLTAGQGKGRGKTPPVSGCRNTAEEKSPAGRCPPQGLSFSSPSCFCRLPSSLSPLRVSASPQSSAA